MVNLHAFVVRSPQSASQCVCRCSPDHRMPKEKKENKKNDVIHPTCIIVDVFSEKRPYLLIYYSHIISYHWTSTRICLFISYLLVCGGYPR